MGRIELLPRDYRSYKANLHSHTTCSDGRFTPGQAKEHYKKNGYSIVAFTDHNIFLDHSDLNDGEFLALAGLEVDTDSFVYGKKNEFNQTCHLCAIARDPACALPVFRAESYTGEAIHAKIDEFHQAGYLVNYNHPAWSCEGPDEFLGYGGFDGLEIYNYSCEVSNNNGDSHNEYAMALRMLRRPIRCIAADDNHQSRGCEDDSCGGWVVFKAPELSYPAIIQAYDEMRFYASTGPEILESYIEGGKLVVECSPVRRAHVTTQMIDPVYCGFSQDNSLTHIEVNLEKVPEAARFLWVQLTDGQGRKAWMNPYYLTRDKG